MKFENITNTEMGGVYGYTFKPGQVVEVKEENLISKFKTYTWLKVIERKKPGPKPKVKTEET